MTTHARMRDPARPVETDLPTPYAPPRAPLREADAAPTFHVVSPLKLVVLFVGTIGLYQIYWFYRHWRQVRAGGDEILWPLPRAVFSVFYVHGLANRIDHALDDSGATRRWWPMTLATAFVAMEVLNYGSAIAWPWLMFHLPNGWLWLEWLGLLVMPFTCACLVRLQVAANIASGDPQATSNRVFTAWNLGWIALGVIATAIVLHNAYRSGGAGL